MKPFDDSSMDSERKAYAARFLVRTKRPSVAGSTGVEHIDSRELARRWSVTKRWIDDQTRSKSDPIPAFKRGKMVRYLYNAADPQNALNVWWSRHTKGKK
jgi:hypothetical protein